MTPPESAPGQGCDLCRKEFSRTISCFLLAGACALALTSCNQNTAEDVDAAGTGETSAPRGASAAETIRLPEDAPDFSGYWQGPLGQYLPPPDGPGPVQDIKGNPWPNIQAPYEADTSNPILQPWVKERLEEQNLLETADQHVPTPQETCSPYGVPWVYALAANVQIVQHPDLVVILYQRGQQFRIIHMDREHPEDLEPDWYGHSVGHYEGDTLVVDTVGFNDRTWIDQFGTPHTEQLHVIERFRARQEPDGDESLQIHLTVEDPGAFTTPWSAIVNYSRSNEPYIEEICAENNYIFIDEMTPGY